MTYIFTHIRKTGGTTFHTSYLPNAFAAGEYFVVNGNFDRHQQELDHLEALSPAEKSRLRIIAGHSTSQLRPSFPDARFITLVREPHERVISLYRHALYHLDGGHPVGKYIREHRLSFLDFVERDLFDVVMRDLLPDRSTEGFMRCTSTRNAQAQQLTGLPADVIDVSDRTRLWSLVQRRFHLVGTSEDYWRFVFHLHVTEGFPLLLFNDRLVRPDAHRFQPTKEELERVRQLNALDTALYKLVEEKFEERVADTWGEETLAGYERYRSALDEFRMRTGGNEQVAEPFSRLSRPSPAQETR
jgi:hypothetical protein